MAKIYHWQYSVLVEHDEREIGVKNDLDRYFRFLQFSLGLSDGEDFLSGEALVGFDWDSFFRFAKKQALVGVAFDGVKRLSKDAAPSQDLLMTWFGQCQRIKRRNVILNEATAEIYERIKAEGFRCCILKGQGNALMYPNPNARTSGDVDVWVNASREETRRLATVLAKDNGCVGKESLNHIEMSVNGIAVELHSTPAILNNPLYNSRLQRWLKRNADLQCGNVVSLPDGAGDVAVPTAAFNVIYQLFHLYHHYLYEGIGLRQFVDYFFVVGGVSKPSPDSLSAGALDEVLRRDLKRLGLWKFAGAVMYVLHEVFGLAESRMLVPMNEKRGGLLLEEILQGGNFGHHGEKAHGGSMTWRHNVYRLQKDWKLVRYYPSECLAEPFYRLWHFFWRCFRN